MENNILINLISPLAKRFQKELWTTCNRKWKNGAQMTAFTAIYMLQNILISVAAQAHPKGSEEGSKLIEDVYESAKKDTLGVWREQKPSPKSS